METPDLAADIAQLFDAPEGGEGPDIEATQQAVAADDDQLATETVEDGATAEPETETEPEVEGEATEGAQDEDSEESFTDAQPQSEEDRAAYDSMLRDYHAKTREIASYRHAVHEGADDLKSIFSGEDFHSEAELGARAVSHLRALYTDPQVAAQFYSDLSQALTQAGVITPHGNAPAAPQAEAQAETMAPADPNDPVAVIQQRLAQTEQVLAQFVSQQQLASQQAAQQQAYASEQQRVTSAYQQVREDPQFKHFNDKQWEMVQRAGVSDLDFLSQALELKGMLASQTRTWAATKRQQARKAPLAGAAGTAATTPVEPKQFNRTQMADAMASDIASLLADN